MLDTERVPCSPPADGGSKFTEIVTDWFGVKMTFDPPLALNPLPVAATVEMLTFALPVFVNVTSCAVDAPTVTFPKFTLVELAVSTAVEEVPPLPPDVPGKPASPQPAAPSNPARAIVVAKARIPEKKAMPSRLKFLRRLNLSEIYSPLVNREIVSRKACSKLLDGGTHLEQVLNLSVGTGQFT